MSLIAIVLGENHPNTLGLVRSLGEKGVEVYLVLRSLRRHNYIVKSRYIFKSYRYTTDEECVNILLSLALPDKPVVFPASDHSSLLLNNHKECLDGKYTLPHITSKSNKTFIDVMNKNSMLDLAAGVGFQTPKSWIINDSNCASFLECQYKKITSATIIKPSVSAIGSKSDIVICNEYLELPVILKKCLDINKEVVVQEYLSKDYEVTILGASLPSGKIVIPGTIKKKHEYPKGRGSGTFSYFSREIDNSVENKIINLIKAVGYFGLFSIDMLVINDKKYFIEINLRNDANSYASTVGGVNLPYIYLLDALGRKTPKVRGLDKSFYVMNEFADFKFSLLYKKNPLFWVGNILKTRCFFTWNKKDVKPFIYKLIYG